VEGVCVEQPLELGAAAAKTTTWATRAGEGGRLQCNEQHVVDLLHGFPFLFPISSLSLFFQTINFCCFVENRRRAEFEESERRREWKEEGEGAPPRTDDDEEDAGGPKDCGEAARKQRSGQRGNATKAKHDDDDGRNFFLPLSFGCRLLLLLSLCLFLRLVCQTKETNTNHNNGHFQRLFLSFCSIFKLLFELLLVFEIIIFCFIFFWKEEQFRFFLVLFRFSLASFPTTTKRNDDNEEQEERWRGGRWRCGDDTCGNDCGGRAAPACLALTGAAASNALAAGPRLEWNWSGPNQMTPQQRGNGRSLAQDLRLDTGNHRLLRFVLDLFVRKGRERCEKSLEKQTNNKRIQVTRRQVPDWRSGRSCPLWNCALACLATQMNAPRQLTIFNDTCFAPIGATLAR